MDAITPFLFFVAALGLATALCSWQCAQRYCICFREYRWGTVVNCSWQCFTSGCRFGTATGVRMTNIGVLKCVRTDREAVKKGRDLGNVPSITQHTGNFCFFRRANATFWCISALYVFKSKINFLRNRNHNNRCSTSTSSACIILRLLSVTEMLLFVLCPSFIESIAHAPRMSTPAWMIDNITRLVSAIESVKYLQAH